MIELKNLSKTYSTGTEALKNISISIADGDIFGIIGMSGAGKSTLVRCINMLEKPTSGSVVINGVDITKMSEKQLRQERHRITMIFQNINLLAQKNVIQNVMFPLQISHKPKEESIKRARELLGIVGISDKEKSYPSQLSGGQQQRVAIARALATDPEILLCDEATSALDPKTTTQILDLLKEINQRLGITIIIITHQMSVVESICKNVAIIEDGEVAEMGPVSQVFTSPQSAIAKRLVFSTDDDSMFSGNPQLAKLRVTYSGAEGVAKPLITQMAVDTGIIANILFAQTKTIDSKVWGTMILEVENDSETIEKAKAYIKKNEQITVEEVTLDV